MLRQPIDFERFIQPAEDADEETQPLNVENRHRTPSEIMNAYNARYGDLRTEVRAKMAARISTTQNLNSISEEAESIS